MVDDVDVARALLDAVAQFGRERGMTEVVGPLGFTDFDPEGMLTDGFDQLGTMATIYNYPYYPKLMEQLGGWEKDNDYVEFKLIVPDTVPEKYTKVARLVEKRFNLHVRILTRHEILKEGYGRKIFHLINETFKDIYGFSELSDKQVDMYVKMYLPFADLRLIPIVEDWSTEEHKMVGVGITLPSLSRAMQKTRRGRLFPFGWWHLLRALKFHKTRIVDLEMIGVLPEYRPKGANALMFAHLIPIYQEYGSNGVKVRSRWRPTRVYRVSGSIWRPCSTSVAAVTKEHLTHRPRYASSPSPPYYPNYIKPMATEEIPVGAQPTAEYTDDNIRHLSDMEHVRTRPGMYIGRLGDGNLPEDGIYVLLKEVVDNSIDEFKMNAGNRIEIDVEDHLRVSVRDYGRGIPQGKLVEAVSVLNTGGKYDSKAFKRASDSMVWV